MGKKKKNPTSCFPNYSEEAPGGHPGRTLEYCFDLWSPRGNTCAATEPHDGDDTASGVRVIFLHPVMRKPPRRSGPHSLLKTHCFNHSFYITNSLKEQPV